MRRSFFALFALTIVAAGSRLALGQENLLANLNARSLGPTTMGGRVSDIAVYEKEPRIFYVATASGGLWKTENGGLTMSAVWDKGSSVAMGAVDVSQSDPNLVWIGTGEQNGRNSASWGDGVYKSTDGGKTWSFVGLKETRHIAQVLIDPKNSETVYVAACGKLWGTNPERGVYKTSDGGKTWEHVLKIDDKTGVVDMVMDPSNNKVLLAAAYERQRYPWNYISGGPGSGLYKSTDAGKTWKKITKGMPEGTIGRIGLSYFKKDPKKVVATIEAGILKPDGSRPESKSGVFVSEDRGESWTRTGTQSMRWFYFSMPRWDPVDENRIYSPHVQLAYSADRGKTFRNMSTSVHVDHHAMWINPADNSHMIIGEDGGVAQTRDRGATWEHLNFMAIGQFYAIGFDMRKPYYVYGGLQDNGSWGGPTQTTRGGVAFWDWFGVGGGDGFYVEIDPNDWSTIYSESQGGAVGRLNLKTGERRGIRPPMGQGEGRRLNWNTPIHISPHNSWVIYVGGHKVFRSINRGETWEAISPDLTTNNPDQMKAGQGSVSPEATGAENHCTVVSISESPRRSGVIWAATDDGLAHVTQDGGKTWANVTANVPGAPKDGWVSRVHASKWADGRCYLTFDNHRLDDLNPYAYVTEDFGKTWTKITNGVGAEEPCHLIREGIKNPDLLFLGTEFGLLISIDRGQNWTRFKSNFPTVPVHDLKVHPRELDLVIGTHGRSIWTLNVSGLEELTAENLAKDAILCKPQNVYDMGRVGNADYEGDRVWVSRNTQPGTDIQYYLKADVAGDVKVEVTDAAGGQIVELAGSSKAGLNTVRWTARARGRVVPVGDYRVILRAGGKEYFSSVTVEAVSGGSD